MPDQYPDEDGSQRVSLWMQLTVRVRVAPAEHSLVQLDHGVVAYQYGAQPDRSATVVSSGSLGLSAHLSSDARALSDSPRHDTSRVCTSARLHEAPGS